LFRHGRFATYSTTDSGYFLAAFLAGLLAGFMA
jgi:hypothetical protein